VASGLCRGSCNARYRRAWDDYHKALAVWLEHQAAGDGQERPEEPAVRPAAADPVWCGRCTVSIKAMLSKLDDQVGFVRREADGHRLSTELDADRVKTSKGTPSPSATLDDMDDMASMLRGWEFVKRGEDPPNRRGDLADEIMTMVTWLLQRFDAMITNPDYAADYGAEVTEWYHRLERRGKTGTGWIARAMACPRCQRRSLVQEQGDDTISCTNIDCHRLLKIDEYDVLVEERHKQLAAAARMRKEKKDKIAA
jgi:hypothetical protein